MQNLRQEAGFKLTKDAIIRDVIMLENQIPTYMLKRILTIETSKNDEELVARELGTLLLSLCEALSPLPLEENLDSSQGANDHDNLWDILYHLIMLGKEKLCEDNFQIHEDNNDIGVRQCGNSAAAGNTIHTRWLENLKSELSRLLDWIKNTDMNILKPIKMPVEKLRGFFNQFPLGSESTAGIEAPVVVMIPSVTELHDAGVPFSPAQGGITAIKFEEKKHTLYLPKTKLDVNTEVIMRNLVAYEALTKSESLMFTRYVELMRAIIDTVEDVQVLVEKGIIEKNLSDEEAEKLFNGMNKSIGPTKTPKLDTEIEKVNKFFNNTEKVRADRLMAKYVYSSWKFFTLFASLVLLGMTALQTFCSAYDCPHLLKSGEARSA